MKNESQFMARLEKLEAEKAHRDRQKLNEALGRLNDSLKAALPETPAETYIYGAGYTGWRSKAITYADLLPPLVARIQADTPTADDKRVVDALPADALVKANMTALCYLQMIADMHTRY